MKQLAGKGRIPGSAAIGRVLLLLIGLLSGCATYQQGLEQALSLTEQGDYLAARQQMAKQLPKQGEDQLLHYLELGLLSHLAGEYRQSNQLLAQADALVEALYTRRLSQLATALVTNPRQSPYRGHDFEQLLIHYYKTLNYLRLAAEQPGQSVALLDSARVEVRRLNIRLDQLTNRQGDYAQRNAQQRQLTAFLLDLFRVLSAGTVDRPELVYRDDGYAHWFSGLLFEMAGEWDNARVSYERAAKVYEQGFAEQFALGSAMGEQAWFDALRMMRRGGGYEARWPVLASKKLSADKQQQLAAFDPGQAQLVIIQHLGRIPAREELNFLLTLNRPLKSLLLTPVPTGDVVQRRHQRDWFASLYSDTSSLALAKNYLTGGVIQTALGMGHRVIPLAPVWEQMTDLGILELLDQGVRVTVPYYPAYSVQAEDSELLIQGQAPQPLLAASSLARIAIQAQMEAAGRDLQLALVRELTKQKLAERTGAWAKPAGDGVGLAVELLAQLAAASTSAADTRNWLTLPAEIRVHRVALPAGAYQISLATPWPDSAQLVSQSRSVELAPGQITLWQARTTAQLLPTEANPLNKLETAVSVMPLTR